jgi:hypothetical protein
VSHQAQDVSLDIQDEMVADELVAVVVAPAAA